MTIIDFMGEQIETDKSTPDWLDTVAFKHDTNASLGGINGRLEMLSRSLGHLTEICAVLDERLSKLEAKAAGYGSVEDVRTDEWGTNGHGESF